MAKTSNAATRLPGAAWRSPMNSDSITLLDARIAKRAALTAFAKLDPRRLWANPVMFVVWVAAVLATAFTALGLIQGENVWLEGQIAFWLWVTVLFATFAEALAEGRGKARADSLRATQTALEAKRLPAIDATAYDKVPATALEPGALVLVEAGGQIPADGEVVRGIASVDESAITGESAPVIRESGGDRSSVTGGTRVVSDRIVVRITQAPGQGFLDRMIGLVEGASRRKTPNELALSVLLVGMTLIFFIVVVTLEPISRYAEASVPLIFLVALLVTLMPTTIGGLLSAIGIAGMDRLVRANIVAKSGRAIEAAGDVDTLLIDKTGTITFGNRMADGFLPVQGVSERDLAEAARLASLADETPEGKSILAFAEQRFQLRGTVADGATFEPFSAETRLSGVDVGERTIRKGAADAVLRWYRERGGKAEPQGLAVIVDDIARGGGTPLVVADAQRILGVIHLKDIVKPGIKARFAELRQAGVRTVMITGDNPLTAAAIAAEAGVDDFLAEATPERKLEFIKAEQAKGRLVAMCGDGANDAPALAQADVGVAMNDGTPAAKEAANLVDLDSDPTKLLQVVRVGKDLLISRGALTTFSVANDVAKYFAILPALFVAAYPELAALDVMNLASPESAILSAIVFNALVILALVPLALRGVGFKPAPAAVLLRQNLVVYGLGGLIAPFVGIKAIDLAITTLGLV